MADTRKYKPGDKVIVRNDLDVSKIYEMEDDADSSDTVNQAMLIYRGQTVTIADNGFSSKYEIKEDKQAFVWTDQMFERRAD